MGCVAPKYQCAVLLQDNKLDMIVLVIPGIYELDLRAALWFSFGLVEEHQCLIHWLNLIIQWQNVTCCSTVHLEPDYLSMDVLVHEDLLRIHCLHTVDVLHRNQCFWKHLDSQDVLGLPLLHI